MLSAPSPAQSATVALVAAARPCVSGFASLATITCNPDPGGAPPAFSCGHWSARTFNHPAQPWLKHLPDVGREEAARCGEADVSAQSLVGALVGKLDVQACNHSQEAGLGLRRDQVA